MPFKWWACGLLLMLAGSAAQAVPKDLDYVVAIVDDDVVLATELVNRLSSVRKQMLAAKMPIPADDVLFNQMLERLIMEDIQLQMGQRAGVRHGLDLGVGLHREQLQERLGVGAVHGARGGFVLGHRAGLGERALA